MVKQTLTKADGRPLILYGRAPFEVGGPAPSPSPGPFAPNAHLRWHPLRGEWVAYATHRQHRTFLPPPEYDPLAETVDPAQPTELPPGTYDAAVFENLFPALTGLAHDPPALPIETRPARGACEVVVFSRERSGSLGQLPLSHLELLLEVWADRYHELGAREDVQYVFIFENRGVEVGVTLHHPHGQIYAYPFVPPLPARELERQLAYYREHQRGLLEVLVEQEVRDGRRIIYGGPHVASFVPLFARYSYEVWLAPYRPMASVASLDAETRADFARALKTTLLKFDALWKRPFPYVMVFHQAPTDGQPHPEAHLHVEFYPAYRMEGRLKYLAGSELGAGVFTADTDPDEKAAELRRVQVSLD